MSDQIKSTSFLGWSGVAAGVLLLGATVGTFLAFLDSMKPSEDWLRGFTKIPASVDVLVHSTYEDPSVVTFDPDVVGATDIAHFARELCAAETAEFSLVRPRLAQRLTGRARAHIFCWR